MAASGNAASPAPSTDDPDWLTDAETGCMALDENPSSAHSMSWDGACRKGEATGAGTLTFFDHGKMLQKITGTFDEGAMQDGHAVILWSDGTRYEGEIRDHVFDGHGVLVTASGDRYEGNWKGNRLNGFGKARWKNGDSYEGEWRDSKSEGHGTQVWANGQRYEGAWANDEPNGEGVLTRPDGGRVAGNFADGVPKPSTHVQSSVSEHGVAAEIPVPKQGPANAVPPQASIAGNSGDSRPGITGGREANASAEDLPDGAALPSGEDRAGGTRLENTLEGKTLVAVDGSSLIFRTDESGFSRELLRPDGTAQTILFSFMSDRLGTVAASDDSGHVIGLFRITDTGMNIDYADGRSEDLVLLAENRLSTTFKPASGASYRTDWYGQGHVFSAAERSAALAEYANSLGANASSGQKERPSLHSEKGMEKSARKPDRNASAGSQASEVERADAVEPLVVRTSIVHVIDHDSDHHTAHDIDSGTPVEESASQCLTVDSDGAHWGFRNRCGYDIQFSYCLKDAPEALADCDEGPASGSVAANGFGALVPDESLKEAGGNHQFRWIACRGGAGEVMAQLEESDPPSGRCTRERQAMLP